jgi:hypothetical protein
MVILLGLLFNTAEDGGDMFLQNVRLSDPHGITTQKTALYIVTTATTSTPYTLHIYTCRIEGRGARAGFLAHPFYIHTHVGTPTCGMHLYTEVY